MALQGHQINTLGTADPRSIQKTSKRNSRYWKYGRWMSATNRYKEDCVEKLESDYDNNVAPNHRHLCEYIAASSPVHCLDGWGYLGRSLHASLSGDANVARHLAYYAELRATMAFLASSGIGVFNRQNYIINSSLQAVRIASGGTHAFAWDALETWATQSQSNELLMKVIKPGGVSLGKWLDTFTASPSVKAVIGQQWLSTWGLDLRRMRKDKDARNESSYRPTAFAAVSSGTVERAVEFVSGVWRLSEPMGSIRFPILDRYLLRASLREAFRITHPRGWSHRKAPIQFKAAVERMFHAVNSQEHPRDLSEEQWRAFLVDSSPIDDLSVLTLSKGESEWTEPDHHIQVISRAFLLLRLASGSTEATFENVSEEQISKLEFWWNEVGHQKAIWQTGDEPEEFANLWPEIEAAIAQLEIWLDGAVTSPRSYRKFWTDAGASGVLMGSCERIGLWSMGL